MRAPFPWFGGKSRVARLVWDRFGDVRNYVEPFAGSLAVLLGRPTEPKIETVNDLDCWIANFWRAVTADPEQVAHWADWPVNEADLHARHLWLVKQTEFRERMKTDPDYFDPKIAGWWVWGISQWIGSGWCAAPDWRGRTNAGRAPRGIQTAAGGATRPDLHSAGVGVHSTPRKRPYLTNHGGGMGVHSNGAYRDPNNQKRPRLGRGGRGVTRQLPDLSGDAGAAGRGIHASGRTWQQRPNVGGEDAGRGVFRKRPDMGHNGPWKGCHRSEGEGLYGWFQALSDRLRRVRVCCGDWMRLLGPAPTTCIGLTGVFLDPPYAVTERADVYNEESRDVAHAVADWAIANGDNPELRIALCGYEGEHQMPESWACVAWKANGGFANQKREGTRGQQNAARERIWFSPHCLTPERQISLWNAAECAHAHPEGIPE